MEESYDIIEDDKMPTTYDQTAITYRKDKCEMHYGPCPVPPANALEDDDGVIRAYFYVHKQVKPLFWKWDLTEYEWYPDGMVIRYNNDGSTTTWHPKPSIQDAIRGAYKGQYLRFYADGSCVVRYHDGSEQRTLFYGEDREVDEPDENNWINSYDVMLGRHNPDMLPEGWYCMKCHTEHCKHVGEESMKDIDNESS